MKTITINNFAKPIKFEYSNHDTFYGDTCVQIYDHFKISLVLTDNCGAVIGDQVFFPQRGDMMIFRPDEIHFGRFPTMSEYQFISILFPPDLFKHTFSSCEDLFSPFFDRSENRINLLRLPKPYQEKLIEIAEELLALLQEENSTSYLDILLFSKAIDALHICCKCYLEQNSIPHFLTTPPLVSKAIQQMDNDFPYFIGLEQLAERCECSVTHLTQTFRRFTGKTIYQYFSERRLEHARRLLERGLSVTNVAYASGFYDTSRFITQFKKQFNTTPSQYKKLFRP